MKNEIDDLHKRIDKLTEDWNQASDKTNKPALLIIAEQNGERMHYVCTNASCVDRMTMVFGVILPQMLEEEKEPSHRLFIKLQILKNMKDLFDGLKS